MRTTFDIPDKLFNQAKHKAVSEGVPLKAIVQRALEREMAGSAPECLRPEKNARGRFSQPWIKHATRHWSVL